jgi:ketosteroid isomerase-like protein
MKKNIILAALALLSISGACHAQSLGTIRKEIGITNARYFRLFQNKDTAIVDLYTADASLLPPNAAAVRGRTALVRDFKGAYADTHIKGVKFATLAVYANGAQYVAEEGSWQVIGTDGKLVDAGKYLKLWKKTKQGWKIFRDIFSSDRKG